MKIAKKRRGLIASIVLSALVLSGCSMSDIKDFAKNNIYHPAKAWIDQLIGKTEQKEDEKKEDTPAAVEKKDVSITIAMEDGKQYNEGEFVAPQISVNQSSLTPVVTYYQGEQALNEAPQTVGDYKIVAKTEENEEYNAGLASKNFLIRKVPTITFFYGNDNPLEADHQFDLALGDYNIYAKSSVEGANFTYSYLDQEGTAINGKPNQPGTYYFVASVERTNAIGNTSKSIRFNLVDSSSGVVAVDPVIKFFYDGQEACLESNWLIGGYADSQFNDNEFDIAKLSYTVDPANATYAETWTLNDQPIEKPTANPLAAGTYALTITVSESEVAHAAVKWAGFVIKSSVKVDPVIKFFYNGNEACLESNWLNGGYVDSQFFAEDFDVTKLTYTVTPNLDAVVTWTLNEVAISAPSNPLAAGTYAMTVTVAESATNNEATRWALFEIKEASSKTEPSIQFFYDGAEKCLENNWLNSGYGDSQYFASEFDVTKLTYTVTPEATAEVSWTLDESPIAAPTNPLAPGTYSMTVSVAESATVQAKVKWALFAIKADKTDPVISFFYDGAAKCQSGHWLNEGYGDSQFYAADFDVTKLTYTVTPELAAEVSWTLDEAPIAAPSNPLAPGTYAMTVSVAAGEDNNAKVDWALFVIKADKTDPTIKFFYDGAEKCTENNWLDGGYGVSQYFASAFDVTKLTYTVSPEATATVSWSLNEAPIEAPTNPLAPGTYAMTVSVTESDTVNAGSKWAGFVIKADKTDPTIRFFYDGAEKCTESNWLDGGYGNSQYYANEFDVTKLSYTVTPELAATVSWSLNENPIEAPTNPLAPGTYAMTVSVAEGDDNNAASKWAGFVINEPAAPTPGTAELPYTCAEARTAAPESGSAADTYVTGIIYTAPTYNSTYKSLTYWISDNGSGNSSNKDGIQIYSGKGIDGADFAAATDLEVGDTVVVKGDLKIYNGTYELDKNNVLISRVQPTVESVVVSGTPATTEYSANEEYSHNGLVATANLSNGAALDVSNVAEWTVNPTNATVGDTSFTVKATYKNVTSAEFIVNVTVSAQAAATSTITLDFSTAGLTTFASGTVNQKIKYTYVQDTGSTAPTFTKASGESQYSLKLYANNYLCIEIDSTGANDYASFKSIQTKATSKNASTAGSGVFYKDDMSNSALYTHSLKTATFTDSEVVNVNGATKIYIKCGSGQYRMGKFTLVLNDK